MIRPVYIVLAGLPASGKTTLRRKMVQGFRPRELSVLSSDDHVEDYASARGQTYSEAFEVAAPLAEKTVSARRMIFVDRWRDILHDQTNLTAKRRAARIAGLPDFYLKICVFITVDEAVRQRRLLQRPGKVIPADVDRKMLDSWEPPTLEEGFDMVAPHYLWESLPYIASFPLTGAVERLTLPA